MLTSLDFLATLSLLGDDFFFETALENKFSNSPRSMTGSSRVSHNISLLPRLKINH